MGSGKKLPDALILLLEIYNVCHAYFHC